MDLKKKYRLEGEIKSAQLYFISIPIGQTQIKRVFTIFKPIIKNKKY